MPRDLLITGADGFIGRSLTLAAATRGWTVRAATRSGGAVVGSAADLMVGDLGSDLDWSVALAGCDTVVHLAARVHVMEDQGEAGRQAFWRINVEATERLARAAANAGVRRLVFVSTVKVLGEGCERAYTDDDPPAPMDHYAQSKADAEQKLLAIGKETGLEVVILRPPLVYGPGVKANFLSMMKSIRRGWPLPLGALATRRSFCYLGNLIDAILFVADHPQTASGAYLVADRETPELREFVRRLARAMDKTAWLLPIPARVLEFAGWLTGNQDKARRLTRSLVVECTGLHKLNWQPPFALDEALIETVRGYPLPLEVSSGDC